MSNFRTSSIFHYTNSLESLKSILSDGFYPNYCKESFPHSKGIYYVGIPMVSFCDIPVSLTDIFRRRYGKFALGLSKEWALEKNINPLLYVHNQNIFNSLHLIHSFLQLLKEESGFVEGSSDQFTFELNQDGLNNLKNWIRIQQMNYATLQLFGYFKPLEINRKEELQSNYEENERRYIVPESNEIPWLWGESAYKEWRGGDAKPQPSDAMKKEKLDFTINDIRWILVPTLDDAKNAMNMIDKLETISFRKINEDERSYLKTMIISFESIVKDL